ncbi:MAG: MraY family glycosyltransferase [Planctomycetota bacterium]
MGQILTVAIAWSVAFVGSLTLTLLAKKMAWKFGAISKPDGERRLHAQPIALGGGSAVYLAALLSVAAVFLLTSHVVEDKVPAALALSAGMLCLLGFYDDLRDMSVRWKLLGQIVCTLPVLMAGCCVGRVVLFGHSFEMGLLGIAWTVGWLVLGTNALNLLDGMDGLASLIGIVISVAVGAIAATQARPQVMLLAFALAGALAGFLVHNRPPARVYLGDSGSMVIGFTLALLALRVSLAPMTPQTTNPTILVALLFVPLMDTTLAIVRRTLKGLNFTVADHSHIHHQLLKRGLRTWHVLGVLGGVSLTTGVVAWWVAVRGQELWGWVALATVTIILANRQLLGQEEWSLTKRLLSQTALPLLGRLLSVRLLPGLRSSSDRPRPVVEPEELAGPEALRVRRPPAEAEANPTETRKAA